MAGCATPTNSAGHTDCRPQADDALTFIPDHPKGADQDRPCSRLKFVKQRLLLGYACLVLLRHKRIGEDGLRDVA